jgi:hypothetical protein
VNIDSIERKIRIMISEHKRSAGKAVERARNVLAAFGEGGRRGLDGYPDVVVSCKDSKNVIIEWYGDTVLEQSGGRIVKYVPGKWEFKLAVEYDRARAELASIEINQRLPELKAEAEVYSIDVDAVIRREMRQ